MEIAVLAAWMPAIVALIALAGAIIAKYTPDRAKREPAWNELASENRSLRTELTELSSKFDRFQAEFRAYRTKTDRKIDAFVNITRDASNQWPETHEGPYFDPDDLAVLEEDEVPVRWKNRIRPLTGLS